MKTASWMFRILGLSLFLLLFPSPSDKSASNLFSTLQFQRTVWATSDGITACLAHVFCAPSPFFLPPLLWWASANSPCVPLLKNPSGLGITKIRTLLPKAIVLVWVRDLACTWCCRWKNCQENHKDAQWQESGHSWLGFNILNTSRVRTFLSGETIPLAEGKLFWQFESTIFAKEKNWAGEKMILTAVKIMRLVGNCFCNQKHYFGSWADYAGL